MYIVTLISAGEKVFWIKFILINHKVFYELKPPAFSVNLHAVYTLHCTSQWLKKQLKLLKNSETMKVKLKREILYYVRLIKFIQVKTTVPIQLSL